MFSFKCLITCHRSDGETYAERNYWSQRHKNWKKFHVKMPRLPQQKDVDERWIEKYIPGSLRSFKGDHNNEVTKQSFTPLKLIDS